MSFSMLLIVVWYIFNFKKIRVDKELYVAFGLSLCAITSTIFAVLIFPEHVEVYGESDVLVWRNNIVNLAILLYAVAVYFFYKHLMDTYRFNISYLLLFYLAFVFSLAVPYFFEPLLYFQLRSLWTLSGNVITFEEFSSIYRFSGILSDPNNAAVVFSAVVAYLIFNQKAKQIHAYGLFLVLLFLTICTMSSTGFILFALLAVFYVLHVLSSSSLDKVIIFSFFCLLALALYPIVSKLGFLESEVLATALERLSENSSESRFKIWKDLIFNERIVYHFFVGGGATLIIDGELVKPHNGNIYLIYAFGFWGYLFFLYIFFRRRYDLPLRFYYFIVLLFLGFSVNVGLYDFRFTMILALLVADYSSKSAVTKLVFEGKLK